MRMKTIPLALTILFALIFGALAMRGEEAVYKPNQINVATVGIVRSTDLKTFDRALGVRLGYDITDKLGGFAQVDGSDFNGSLIENAQVGVKLGKPIGHIRPYIVGTYAVSFPRTDNVFGLGAGVDVKVYKSVYGFAEAKYTKGTANGANGFEGTLGLGIGF